ncbi:MAG TPA: DUF2950 domain-containing protein [Candidatus Polarisedimenticolia bacterium]|nr:DUF2950 domain-containing protein [Candidatus Polarisedimenticolia bacterium]
MIRTLSPARTLSSRSSVVAAFLGGLLAFSFAAAQSTAPAKPPATGNPPTATTPAKPATTAKKPTTPPKPATPPMTFETPEKAAQALIDAAAAFDLEGLKKVLGSDGLDLVVSADKVQDENTAREFADQARQKHAVVVDSTNPKIATLNVGPDDWPTPMPIVQRPRGQWRFDSKGGRVELLRRRIGRNEIDAIRVCRGFVEAQDEYALTKHGDSKVNQYAQKIISSPGKQDGLAWQAPNGAWEGPIAEPIARAIAEGYDSRLDPYHGYLFKILKGQGSAAPLGRLDFVVKGAMIGGFALAAAPAEYGSTGVMTFIVSHDGVVYERDLGEQTLQTFKSMTLFNPTQSWKPVEEP